MKIFQRCLALELDASLGRNLKVLKDGSMMELKRKRRVGLGLMMVKERKRCS